MNTSPQQADTTTKRPFRFRFTLRTMFIVITTVTVAVALFVRYPDCVGVFFGLLVLLAGWCYSRGNRSGAVGHLVILGVFWIALQFFGPYTGLRNRVVWVVGTERLQQWAVETLDNPPPADEHGRIILDRDSLPEDIQNVAGYLPEYNVVFLSDDGKADRLQFGHGGGFYHWGIVVGRPGFTPVYPKRYDRIADGIWGYRE
jgi:hypothetical protein